MKKMKHDMSIGMACFITCILSYSSTAQNYKDDMLKIRTACKIKYHSYSIKYRYYPYDSVKRVTDSINGTCVVDSEYWYYKINTSAGVLEYLKNGKYFVEVNHVNKVILISKSSVFKSDAWNINKIDSLLQVPAVTTTYKEKGEEGEYTLTFDGESWNKMKLVFNRKRYTIDAVWLYSPAKGKIFGEPYNKPVIGIFCTSYSETVPSKNDFSEDKYVQQTSNGSFEVGRTYKGFKLLDYVHKKT